MSEKETRTNDNVTYRTDNVKIEIDGKKTIKNTKTSSDNGIITKHSKKK